MKTKRYLSPSLLSADFGNLADGLRLIEEINKLSNSTKLQDEIMESKAKYAKAINDYLSMKDKAISKKIEIAKLLTEIYKHGGSLEDTIKDENGNQKPIKKYFHIVDNPHNVYLHVLTANQPLAKN